MRLESNKVIWTWFGCDFYFRDGGKLREGVKDCKHNIHT